MNAPSSNRAASSAPLTDAYSTSSGTVSTTRQRDDGTFPETNLRSPWVPVSPRVTAVRITSGGPPPRGCVELKRAARSVDQVSLGGGERRPCREEPLREALHHPDRPGREQDTAPRRARERQGELDEPAAPAVGVGVGEGRRPAQRKPDVLASRRVRVARPAGRREHAAASVEDRHALPLCRG